MPDDHSKLVPPLPIPNRTVKQLSADDSAGSRVKVGHRQALISAKPPVLYEAGGFVLIAPCVHMAKTTAQQWAEKLVKSALTAMIFVFQAINDGLASYSCLHLLRATELCGAWQVATSR